MADAAVMRAMEAENNKPPAETQLTGEELAGIRNHPNLDKLYYSVADKVTEVSITYGRHEPEILAALVKAARKNLAAVRKHGVTIIMNAAFDATYDKTTDRAENLPRVYTMEEFAVKIDTEIPAIINEYEMGDISTFRSMGYIRSELARIDASFADKHAAAEALLKASRGARNAAAAAAAAAATAAGGAGGSSKSAYEAEHHSGVPSGLEGASGGSGRAYGGRRRKNKGRKTRSKSRQSRSRKSRNRSRKSRRS